MVKNPQTLTLPQKASPHVYMNEKGEISLRKQIFQLRKEQTPLFFVVFKSSFNHSHLNRQQESKIKRTIIYVEKRAACVLFAGLSLLRLLIESPSLFLQLRVIRAFRSTLEDLEERRSVHSLHSLHSMRSSRSHTGPRPLSDFTYIDEDSTNLLNKLRHQTEQDHDSSRGSRIPSINSPVSPLLLNVPGSGSSYSNNHRHTNNNRNSNNTNDHQPLSPNHTTSRTIDNGIQNSPSLSANEPILSLDLPKLVHETSI